MGRRQGPAVPLDLPQASTRCVSVSPAGQASGACLRRTHLPTEASMTSAGRTHCARTTSTPPWRHGDNEPDCRYRFGGGVVRVSCKTGLLNSSAAFFFFVRLSRSPPLFVGCFDCLSVWTPTRCVAVRVA